MTWKFTIIDSWGNAPSESLWREWEKRYAADEAASAFSSPSLCRAWLETYLPLRRLEPRFVQAKCAHAEVFYPLLLWTKGWKHLKQRHIIPVGFSDFDYTEPLVTGEPTAEEWRDFWTELAALLRTHRGFRADAFYLDGLRESRLPDSEERFTESETCPFVDLNEFKSGEDYLAQIKVKAHKELLRRISNLESCGTVAVKFYGNGDVEKALAELPRFLEHHTHHWPNAYKAPGYHERLLREGLKAGTVLLGVLFVNQTAIAWQIYMMDRTAVRFYMPTHDATWKQFSPGHILRYKIIERAIAQRIPQFDFLRGAEAHKNVWANKVARLYCCNQPATRPLAKLRCAMTEHLQRISRAVSRANNASRAERASV